MPDHATHELETLIVAPAVGLIAWALSDAWHAWTVVCGLALGAVWLSPDLDHSAGCAAARRWGPMRAIWAPYAHMLPHRSFWSHGPLIGTLGRLAWLGLLLSPIAAAVLLQGSVSLSVARVWALEHGSELVAVVVGIEVSALLHVTLDLVA